ncbi:MAG: hypothetical protein IKW89_02745, partial [Bacteroidales bacterium]|nr:hypothetical protein [Bacteroidales bacterium]
WRFFCIHFRGSLQSCCRQNRQHHFRSTALETSTSASRRRSLTRGQTGAGGAVTRLSLRAAPFTALQPGQAGPEGYNPNID